MEFLVQLIESLRACFLINSKILAQFSSLYAHQRFCAGIRVFYSLVGGDLAAGLTDHKS
jgi:hypothetical protein